MFKFLAVLKKKNSDELEIMLLDEKQQIFSIEAAERYLKQFAATHDVDFLFEVANLTTAKLSMKAVLDKYPNHPKYEQIKQKLKEVLEPFKPK
jgi:predicted RNase H-like nuclease